MYATALAHVYTGLQEQREKNKVMMLNKIIRIASYTTTVFDLTCVQRHIFLLLSYSNSCQY